MAEKQLALQANRQVPCRIKATALLEELLGMAMAA